MILVCNFLVTI